MAKQSGPRIGVKGAALLACGLFALSGCASPEARWLQPGKSAKTVRADLAQCERDAEKLTLTRLGQTRGAYGMDNAPGVAGGARNQSPMGMHDRNDDADRFRRAVERCMSGMGYADANAPATARRR
ncbi:MAG: hypothetical protein FJX59_15515 [Alphaproteobacteria bacterium]|nr:hypothetical protein [Alphaproteobacteria bacterium]